MRQLNLTQSGPTLNVARLDALEYELGVKIPDTIRTFLLEENGGYMPDLPGNPKYYIRGFLTVEDSNVSLQAIFHVISEMFGNSKNWLPFGTDYGDWIYCLCLKPKLYGKVYLMRTDEIDEEDAFDFVCNSFEEFIEGVQPQDS